MTSLTPLLDAVSRPDQEPHVSEEQGRWDRGPHSLGPVTAGPHGRCPGRTAGRWPPTDCALAGGGGAAVTAPATDIALPWKKSHSPKAVKPGQWD